MARGGGGPSKTRIMCEILQQKVKRSHFPTTVFTKIQFLNNSLRKLSERAGGILLTERDVPGHASPHFLIRGCASTGECTQKLAKYYLKSRK